MFTPGGQINHLTFAGLRGGGGKGGGGGGQPPPQPRTYTDPVDGTVFVESPAEQFFGGGVNPDGTPRLTAAQQYNQHLLERKAGEKTASDAKLAQAAADKTTAQTKFTDTRQKAYDDALQATIHEFQTQGVDPNQYLESDIKPALQRSFNSIQDLDPNPAAAFPTSLGSTILGNITSGNRSRALNTYNTTFNPTYADTALPSTLVNDYLDSILNEQFDPLSQQLTNAQKRGTLTDTGYDAANTLLGTKKTAARSKVQTLGEGILGADRKTLNDYISGGRSDVNALGANSTFDINPYTTHANEFVGTEKNKFGGELRDAVGGTKFADLQELIQAGGAVQGAHNPTADNPIGLGPASPAQLTEDELARRSRGLGNTGAF